VGHQQPPSFVAGTAGLASIADELLTCARLSQTSRVSHANARQVLPSKRPCRAAAVARAMGQLRAFRREQSNSDRTPLALRSNAFQGPNQLRMIAYRH
jgi:hypothetical protein